MLKWTKYSSSEGSYKFLDVLTSTKL
jgi:hypothetical protein